MTHRGKMLIAGLALGCLWLAGCYEPQPQQVVPTVVRESPGVDVTFQPVTPPPPLHETKPDAPSDEYIWIPGYWVWHGHSYIWTPGRWAIPPRPGAKWVPDKWSPGNTTPDVPAHWE